MDSLRRDGDETDALWLSEQLAGNPLYTWQRRLLEEWFLRDRAPSTIDVPTGLGKTKVIALWLAARAFGANLPRRLIYAVDRRAVVDQATIEAEAVAVRLKQILDGEELSEQRRAVIRENLALTDWTLPISTLRGQFVDNRAWLDHPHGAAIVVGTVDMIGSRVLFSGYGVSSNMRPVHAALLGCDSLFAIDEAHLVPPFEAMLRGVVSYRDAGPAIGSDAAPRSLVMALSATSGKSDPITTFSLTAEDAADPAAARRLAAEKRLEVFPVVAASELAESLASRAWERATGDERIVIFCNSRKDAQRVISGLEARGKKTVPPRRIAAELLVGERRLRERTLLYDPPEGSPPSIVESFAPGFDNAGNGAVFLVATSAGEVGVDLDADHIVCDLVPWERMVQRFGRVNRRSDPGVSRIDIVPSVSGDDVEDIVENERLAILLAPFESAQWPLEADGSRDASPNGIAAVKRAVPDLLERAQTPRPLHPTITAPVVEAWSMTGLREHPGRPLVDPWLRGWIEQRPQTRVLWRRYLPLTHDSLVDASARAAARGELTRYFEAGPPHVTEILEAPSDRVARWLKVRFSKLGKKGQEHAASVESEAPAQERAAEEEAEAPVTSRFEPEHPPLVVVLDDRLEAVDLLQEREIESTLNERLTRRIANRILVLDARVGGLDPRGLLDDAAGDVPPTVDVEATWGIEATKVGLRRFRYGSFGPEPKARKGDLWRREGYSWTATPESEDPTTLWIEVWRAADATFGDAAIANKRQALGEHLSWTRDAASKIASSLRIAEERATTLAVAGGLHDLGKSRSLWQDAMRAPLTDRPFAKLSGGSSLPMLNGYRHEFGSLTDMEFDTEVAGMAQSERELALHVVAAHHGRARPTINAFDPDRAPSRSVELSRAVALRFARLQRRFGAWDLAWWEAILRCADWSASRRNNEGAP